jgi:hypothetical protein
VAWLVAAVSQAHSPAVARGVHEDVMFVWQARTRIDEAPDAGRASTPARTVRSCYAAFTNAGDPGDQRMPSVLAPALGYNSFNTVDA